MSIEAMKQALEALEEVQKYDKTSEWFDKKVSALRQAIEQAESQQQIAEDFIKYGASWSKRGKRIDPSEIYAPAQTPVHASDTNQERVDETAKDRHEWVGLTDEEIEAIYYQENRADVVLLTQAKLKEKNT